MYHNIERRNKAIPVHHYMMFPGFPYRAWDAQGRLWFVRKQGSKWRADYWLSSAGNNKDRPRCLTIWRNRLCDISQSLSKTL